MEFEITNRTNQRSASVEANSWEEVRATFPDHFIRAVAGGPYDIGDLALVMVTSDLGKVSWEPLYVAEVTQFSPGSKWQVRVAHGLVGTNYLSGVVWSDDTGHGPHIKPIPEEYL